MFQFSLGSRYLVLFIAENGEKYNFKKLIELYTAITRV